MSGETNNLQLEIPRSTDEHQSLKENMSEQHTLVNTEILAKTSLTISLEEIALDKEEPQRGTQYLVAIIVSVSGFIIGTSLGWTSPAGPMMKNDQYDFRVTEANVSWIAALMPLGALIGCPVMAGVVDSLGRKKTMALLTIPTLVGWATIIWARSVTWICVGRAMTGFASGSYSVIVPLYTSEIADKEIRGTLGTYFQLQMFLGILYTYVIGSYSNVFCLSAACALVPAVFACLLVLIPESPIYYLMKADVDNARSSLRYFRESHGNVDEELETMQVSLVKAERDRLSMVKAFQTVQAKRGLFIGLGLMVFQQFTGCNAVIFYATTIFNATGSAIQSNTSAVIVGIIALMSTYGSTLAVDRLGRKFLLLVSVAAMGICTLLIGGFFMGKDFNYNVSPVAFIPLVSLCTFIVAFSIGIGPVTWILMGEIFPVQIQDATSSIVCMSNWFFAFLVTKYFTALVSVICMYNTFFLFTAFSVLGTFFVWFAVPETKGKTMNEIQVLLGP